MRASAERRHYQLSLIVYLIAADIFITMYLAALQLRHTPLLDSQVTPSFLFACRFLRAAVSFRRASRFRNAPGSFINRLITYFADEFSLISFHFTDIY
jgi:hypothetical protein